MEDMTWFWENYIVDELLKQEGHDGPGIAHLRAIAHMPHFFFFFFFCNSSRRHFNDFAKYQGPNW